MELVMGIGEKNKKGLDQLLGQKTPTQRNNRNGSRSSSRPLRSTTPRRNGGGGQKSLDERFNDIFGAEIKANKAKKQELKKSAMSTSEHSHKRPVSKPSKENPLALPYLPQSFGEQNSCRECTLLQQWAIDGEKLFRETLTRTKWQKDVTKGEIHVFKGTSSGTVLLVKAEITLDLPADFVFDYIQRVTERGQPFYPLRKAAELDRTRLPQGGEVTSALACYRTPVGLRKACLLRAALPGGGGGGGGRLVFAAAAAHPALAAVAPGALAVDPPPSGVEVRALGGGQEGAPIRCRVTAVCGLAADTLGPGAGGAALAGLARGEYLRQRRRRLGELEAHVTAMRALRRRQEEEEEGDPFVVTDAVTHTPEPAPHRDGGVGRFFGRLLGRGGGGGDVGVGEGGRGSPSAGQRRRAQELSRSLRSPPPANPFRRSRSLQLPAARAAPAPAPAPAAAARGEEEEEEEEEGGRPASPLSGRRRPLDSPPRRGPARPTPRAAGPLPRRPDRTPQRRQPPGSGSSPLAPLPASGGRPRTRSAHEPFRWSDLVMEVTGDGGGWKGRRGSSGGGRFFSSISAANDDGSDEDEVMSISPIITSFKPPPRGVIDTPSSKASTPGHSRLWVKTFGPSQARSVTPRAGDVLPLLDLDTSLFFRPSAATAAPTPAPAPAPAPPPFPSTASAEKPGTPPPSKLDVFLGPLAMPAERAALAALCITVRGPPAGPPDGGGGGDDDARTTGLVLPLLDLLRELGAPHQARGALPGGGGGGGGGGKGEGCAVGVKPWLLPLARGLTGFEGLPAGDPALARGCRPGGAPPPTSPLLAADKENICTSWAQKMATLDSFNANLPARVYVPGLARRCGIAPAAAAAGPPRGRGGRGGEDGAGALFPLALWLNRVEVHCHGGGGGGEERRSHCQVELSLSLSQTGAADATAGGALGLQGSKVEVDSPLELFQAAYGDLKGTELQKWKEILATGVPVTDTSAAYEPRCAHSSGPGGGGGGSGGGAEGPGAAARELRLRLDAAGGALELGAPRRQRMFTPILWGGEGAGGHGGGGGGGGGTLTLALAEDVAHAQAFDRGEGGGAELLLLLRAGRRRRRRHGRGRRARGRSAGRGGGGGGTAGTDEEDATEEPMRVLCFRNPQERDMTLAILHATMARMEEQHEEENTA